MGKLSSILEILFSSKESKTKLGKLFPEFGLFTLEQTKNLEKVLGFKISKAKYYEQAFTHRSLVSSSKPKELISNQRLEYFGDSILGMVIGEHLFKSLPQGKEGDLTKLRSAYVNNSTLAKCAEKLKLNEFLLLGSHAERTFEKGYESIMSDAMEALVAAIYFDNDIEVTKKFILTRMLPIMEDYKNLVNKNYKSILLEKFQADQQDVPTYNVLNEEGPDHNKEFEVGVYLNDKLIGKGKGKSKKSAEQEAALNALNSMSS